MYARALHAGIIPCERSTATSMTPESAQPFRPASLTRPDEALHTYYLLCALCTVVAFPIVYLALFIQYKTLRYKLDEEGVSLAVGLLFKKETTLAYRRIQDIHVKRSLFQRWLGISTVEVMTASGSAGAEISLEGVRDAESLRDFLYARMRGAGDDDASPSPASAPATDDDAVAILREIRDALRELRRSGPQ